jgi:hypothetical protein
LTPSIHYRHIGWVIFNTSLVDGAEGTTLALHSGRYFAGHQHPDQNSFVIHDLVASAGKAARYDWMLHSVTPIATDDSHNSFRLACPRAALRGRFLAPARVRLDVTTGFPVEPVDGYSTRPVPPEKYVPEWRLYVTPQSPTAEQEFLVAMQIQRLSDQPEPEAMIETTEATGAHGLRIRAGNRSHLVLVRMGNADGSLRGGGLETDGQVAAVEVGPDGSVLRAMAIGARRLCYNGQTLLDAETQQGWSSDRAK